MLVVFKFGIIIIIFVFRFLSRINLGKFREICDYLKYFARGNKNIWHVVDSDTYSDTNILPKYENKVCMKNETMLTFKKI